MIGGYHLWFCEELNRRLEKECLTKAVELASGMAGDYPDYRYGVGLIAGMKLAAEIADEIRKEQDAA